MTATATKSARKPQARSAKVTRNSDGMLVLWLTVGKAVTCYGVRHQAAPEGATAAYHLIKADTGSGDGAEYDVLLDGNRSTCECLGFLKHGMCKDGTGCKHIAALTAALAAGSLSAVDGL